MKTKILLALIAISLIAIVGCTKSDYYSATVCNADCVDAGYENGDCLLLKESETDMLNVGTCRLRNSDTCSVVGQCNCYCTPIPEVLGCTDIEAVNYNPDANVDDGSCEYEEFCTKKDTDFTLDLTEATEIALASVCVENATLTAETLCNEDTGTWWIDLDLEKEGCDPACVVDIEAGTAEINWRCTGALPPEE